MKDTTHKQLENDEIKSEVSSLSETCEDDEEQEKITNTMDKWDEHLKNGEKFDILTMNTDHFVKRMTNELEHKSTQTHDCKKRKVIDRTNVNARDEYANLQYELDKLQLVTSIRKKKLESILEEVKILRLITEEIDLFLYEDLKDVPYSDLTLENVMRVSNKEEEKKHSYFRELFFLKTSLLTSCFIGGYFALWTFYLTAKKS